MRSQCSMAQCWPRSRRSSSDSGPVSAVVRRGTSTRVSMAAILAHAYTRAEVRIRTKKRAPLAAAPTAEVLQEERLSGVSGLAVRRDVQPFAFFLFRHAQADQHVGDGVGDRGDHAR